MKKREKALMKYFFCTDLSCLNLKSTLQNKLSLLLLIEILSACIIVLFWHTIGIMYLSIN